MPKLVIQNYIKFVKKFKVKDISLISYERLNLKTTFNPEELNIFFDNKTYTFIYVTCLSVTKIDFCVNKKISIFLELRSSMYNIY